MNNEKTIQSLESKAARKGSWKAFFKFVGKLRLSWGLIILATAVSIGYSEITTHLPGSTATVLGGDFSTGALRNLFLNLISMLIVSMIIALISTFAQARSLRMVRNTIWSKMMGVQTKYYAQHDPSYLLSAVTSDAQMTVTSIITFITGTIPALYYLYRAFGMIRGYNLKLLYPVAIMIPFYLIYGILVGRWQFRTSTRIQTRIGGLTGYLVERLRNLELIKIFNTEKSEEENGAKTAKKLYKANMHSVYINTAAVSYILLSDVIVMIAAVIWGAILLRNKTITLESWLAFFFFIPMINGQMRGLVQQWIGAKSMQGYAARLSALTDAPQENGHKNNGTATTSFKNGDINFNGISFSYGAVPVLSDINVRIPKGKSTAIVGLCGSGKSTMMSLLERLYEPSAGTITIGDTPIDKYELRDYRQHFAYVQQDAGIFSGTIREILSYGVQREVLEAELIKVAKLAGIHQFITTLPKKFDTEIALWGTSLSGGQRQRLVMARELLKNADILLLDEPTSALDAATSREILDSILCLFKDKTIVTITHDLALISAVDQIVFVNNGTIQACGIHSELMEKNSLYRELVEEQSYQEAFAL